MSAHCLDTSAWLEITHGGPNAARFAKTLKHAQTILVSTITLYEIARYTGRIADASRSAQILAFLHQHAVVPVSSDIAELAATLGARHKLAMADSLIYATTIAHNAILWTQDADFDRLPHVKYFPKIKKS